MLESIFIPAASALDSGFRRSDGKVPWFGLMAIRWISPRTTVKIGRHCNLRRQTVIPAKTGIHLHSCRGRPGLRLSPE